MSSSTPAESASGDGGGGGESKSAAAAHEDAKTVSKSPRGAGDGDASEGADTAAPPLTPAAASLLQRSLDAARAAGAAEASSSDDADTGTTTTSTTADTNGPAAALSGAALVGESEKVFHIWQHVYLASEYGAVDDEAFRELGFKLVVNCTSGHFKVANKYAARGVEYLNFEIHDHVGENPTRAIAEGCDALVRAGAAGHRAMVHCSAGLSRSATVVLGWLMKGCGMSLAEAVRVATAGRGRRMQCNPSFWTGLMKVERAINSGSSSSGSRLAAGRGDADGGEVDATDGGGSGGGGEGGAVVADSSTSVAAEAEPSPAAAPAAATALGVPAPAANAASVADAAPAAPRPPPPSFDYTAWVVADLSRMGFDADAVRAALLRFDWDADAAFEFLLGGGDPSAPAGASL